MAIQRTTLNVSLTPEVERFMAAQVASDCCQTTSEVVRAGLRLFENSEGLLLPPIDAGPVRACAARS
jgi:putative addiction module CopG family antidote